MKRSIILLIGVLLLTPVTKAYADTTAKEVSFVRCVDGDTAVFLVDNEEIKFRFLAIDTPETVHPTKEVEAFGKNASEYTCNKLTNAQKIIVEYENSNKVDKYGRSLAWIWVDGSLLQKELVSIGYGEVAYIYGNYRYTNSLCLIQKEAKDSNLGLWSEGKEEGYCSTIDLEGVVDNIDPENIGVAEELPKEPEEEKDIEETEEEKEVKEAIEEANDFADKISNYLVDNDNIITKFFIFAFVGSAALYAIFKGHKKK